MSAATFTKAALEAYKQMSTQESHNDYFVCRFQPDSAVMDVVAQGRGGMAAVAEELDKSFIDAIGVAMFRVTALDSRGTTTSYRTKLVHVIFVGPKTKVLLRAKVASWNANFKQPFTCNLSIQTDNAKGDLVEANIEKRLRAAGGAHQPTSFDFTNSVSSAGSLGNKSATMHAIDTNLEDAPREISPSSGLPRATTPNNNSNNGRMFDGDHHPTTPGGTHTYLVVFRAFLDMMQAKNAEGLTSCYDEDAKLVVSDINTGVTTIHLATDAIQTWFQAFFDSLGGEQRNIIQTEKMQPDDQATSEGAVFLHWCSQSVPYGCDTLIFIGGKIVCHTMVYQAGKVDELKLFGGEDANSVNTQDDPPDAPSQSGARSSVVGDDTSSTAVQGGTSVRTDLDDDVDVRTETADEIGGGGGEVEESDDVVVESVN